MLNDINEPVVVISRGLGAKALAYFDHEKIKQEIIILDSEEVKNYFEQEIYDLPLGKTIFISNLKSEILLKEAPNLKYRYFLLS